ncbi:MAG: hypothetical protein ACI9FG_001983, partial [Crocinitomicaceae bacterium]
MDLWCYFIKKTSTGGKLRLTILADHAFYL